MKLKPKKGTAIEIKDGDTGEVLKASLDSIILSSDQGKVRAIMAVAFQTESYPTLLKWLEVLRGPEK